MKDLKEKNFFRRGFTLTEFLIVIAIVMILSTIGLISLYGRNRGERFDSSVLRLVGVITEAVDNSKTLKYIDDTSSATYKNAEWGVELTPSGCAGGPGYSLVLYGVTVFNYGKYVLPEGVDYDKNVTIFPPSPPSCRVKAISFDKNTGAADANAKLKIYLVSDPAVSSTISISPLGQVTFTSDGKSLGI